MCGSCYSFSTSASVESLYAMKTGELYKLSEQYIVSCDTSNYGCDGGNQDDATDFLVTNECILEADYPYTSGRLGVAGPCRSDGKTTYPLVIAPGTTKVDSTYSAFKSALRNEPLNISFESVNSFDYYKRGVYKPTDCENHFNSINHAMQAVGFGYYQGMEYAIIRNEWGTDWGIDGYAYVYLDPASTTGVCSLYADNYETTVGF